MRTDGPRWRRARPRQRRPIYRQIYERLREGFCRALRRGPAAARTLARRAPRVNRSTVVHAIATSPPTPDRSTGRVRLAGRLARCRGRPDRPPACRVGHAAALASRRVSAVLGELAASGHGDLIASSKGSAGGPLPLDDLTRSFARAGGDVNLVLTYATARAMRAARRDRDANARAGLHGRPARRAVLTGSTQGITLVAQSLAEPATRSWSSPDYPGALQIFQMPAACDPSRSTRTGCGPITSRRSCAAPARFIYTIRRSTTRRP